MLLHMKNLRSLYFQLKVKITWLDHTHAELTIRHNQLACINITTIDDDNVEGDEAFTVSISSVSLPNSVMLLDPSMKTATLMDNDGKYP